MFIPINTAIFNNTNIFYTYTGELPEAGTVRETFFCNQLASAGHKVEYGGNHRGKIPLCGASDYFIEAIIPNFGLCKTSYTAMLKEYLNNDYSAITILGPTASGKTKAAVALAHRIKKLAGKKAEILSADSRQVYIGMDIGTGKDMDEYGDVPVHLIDIVPAGEKYNIFRYRRDFSKAYSQIVEKGNLPIICGGSGLYIEAATCGYELKEVEPNMQLRAELEQKTMEELIDMFTKLKLQNGTQPHNNTDFDTQKRVIRAIEIELEIAKKEIKNEFLPLPDKNSILFLGVDVDRATRNRRIDIRLESRLEEGMIDEVKKLLYSGIKAEDLIYYGLEYKYVTLYLTGELEYSTMVEKLQTAIHQFAKRQMTWFRGMERKGIKIKWLPLEEFFEE